MPSANELRCAIEGASDIELPIVAKQLNAALVAGIITEADYMVIGTLLDARRQAPCDPRDRARSGDAKRLGATKYIFPPRRLQRSPDKAASRERRRKVAMSGGMPATLAWPYTIGEIAVLTVVGDEVRARGVCVLPIGAIASRAGVSHRHAQQALRLAAANGMLTIEERPRLGAKSLTNLVKVLSREWRMWLAAGRKNRVQIFPPHEYGDTKKPTVGLARREVWASGMENPDPGSEPPGASRLE